MARRIAKPKPAAAKKARPVAPKPKPESVEKIKQIKKLTIAGLKERQIAEHLGMSRSIVHYFLQEHITFSEKENTLLQLNGFIIALQPRRENKLLDAKQLERYILANLGNPHAARDIGIERGNYRRLLQTIDRYDEHKGNRANFTRKSNH